MLVYISAGFLAILVGWILISLVSGVVVYLFAMTTNHASFQSQKMMASEKKSALNAHTKDPFVMEPLNSAKEKWIEKRRNDIFDVLSVISRDGLRLYGYYLGSTESGSDRGKTIILVHGMMDSAAGMAYLFDEYARRDWSVFAIDLRAHGESEGTKRTMGVREGEDLALWVELVRARFGAREIFLHGVSMGAVTVLSYASNGKNLSESVKGLILDSCFASHRATLTNLLRVTVGNWFIARSMVYGASLACFFSTGVSFDRMETVKLVRKVSLPMLFFHGQADVLVPVSSMRGIFESALKRPNEIVVIPAAPHIGTYFYAPELYMSKIMNFTGGIK